MTRPLNYFPGVNPITAGSFRKTPLISVTDKEDDEKEENQKKVKERSDSGEKKPEEVENNGTAATERLVVALYTQPIKKRMPHLYRTSIPCYLFI